MPIYRCWNHLYKAVERWLKAHGGKNDDVQFYSSSLRGLLLQPTREAYEKQLKLCREGHLTTQPWQPVFDEYYTDHIESNIEALAAYCVKPVVGNYFESLNIYSCIVY